MRKDKIQSAIGILIIIIFFILSSYIVQSNLEYVRGLIGYNIWSMVLYILIAIIATVIAPVSALPLLPVASNVWGWLVTAILSIIGWTLGALIAFALARKYGVPLVKKFVSLDKIARFERLIPKENLFWGIVFLRMAVPVDVLSYVLGLFSHIRFRTYAIATLIGILPFAFVFAYLGRLPFSYQIFALYMAFIIILIGLVIALIYKKRRR